MTRNRVAKSRHSRLVLRYVAAAGAPPLEPCSSKGNIRAALAKPAAAIAIAGIEMLLLSSHIRVGLSRAWTVTVILGWDRPRPICW